MDSIPIQFEIISCNIVFKCIISSPSCMRNSSGYLSVHQLPDANGYARPTQPTIYNCIRHLKAGRQSVMDAQREGEPYEVLGMSKVVLLE